jgi:HSP20 family protein
MATTLTPFNPFVDVDRLFRLTWGTFDRTSGFAPAADVARSGDDLVARFDLPGIDPDKDVTVEVDGRRLVVRGERQDGHENEDTNRRVREVRYGSFRRVVGLPAAVDPTAIRASYDAGVLTVTVAGVYVGRTPTRIDIAKAA